MNNRLYTFFATIVMVVLLAPVTETRAQRQVQVMELQKQPDGTEIYVPKTIEVPEKPASVIAAEKARAASVTAEEDDLQYYLNSLAETGEPGKQYVIDLSTFKDTVRQTTLELNQGISLKFTNGAIRRWEGMTKGNSLVEISNNTEVEFDETVVLSGENVANNGTIVYVNEASLRTAAMMVNTQCGTQNRYYFPLIVNGTTSKLEITGGIISGSVSYNSNNDLLMSGGAIVYIDDKTTGRLFLYGEGDLRISGGRSGYVFCEGNQNVIVSGKDAFVEAVSFHSLSANLKLSSPFVSKIPVGYHNTKVNDGLIVATGIDGYQISKTDLCRLILSQGWITTGESYVDLSVYELRLEGNSVVVRQKGTAVTDDPMDSITDVLDLDSYDELTKGILVPSGKRVRMTGTKKLKLADNFSGDYIFKTEDDALLDITVPGFECSESTVIPRYSFVANGSTSRIRINKCETEMLTLDNTMLYTENGGIIDCYANISANSIYNSDKGTMNIYSDAGEITNATTEYGAITTITGKIGFTDTFAVDGTVTMLSENVTNLRNLILGKYSHMKFTTNMPGSNGLVASFKNDDYLLNVRYIDFPSSSNYNQLKFSLKEGHCPFGNAGIYIGEINKTELALLKSRLNDVSLRIDECYDAYVTFSEKVYSNKDVLTEEEYNRFSQERMRLASDFVSIRDTYNYLSRVIESPDFGSYDSVDETSINIVVLNNRVDVFLEDIASLQSELKSLVSSRKKTFTNTDDLQDYLNSLAENKGTTPSDPAKVSVEKGTNIDDVTIPKDTHVEIDITDKDGNSGTDDLQAYLNGLVTVKEGGSLKLTGKYVISGGALNPRIDVRGIIDIYATIVVEGTREEVIHVYSGGKANWRGEMQGGKIVNEGELNHYSGSTDYVENRGTANHRGGTCHHVVNYVTYYLYGGTIDGSASPYTCAFENHGTARLTGGTIIHRQTLIYIVKGATTYIDGTTLDDSNATTTVLAYDDFHIRGDYAPKSIVIDNGVCIHFITVWTVRWHITFIDNRTTIRKVIFHSDVFDVNDEYIKYIDSTLPDRYRWYWNQTANGLEIRDDKVFDADDLQHFLELLKTRPGTASDPVVLDGGSHTVPLPLDESGVFRFPGNTYIIVRDIVFRYVSPAAKRRWTVPSGSTVVLRNVTIDGGEGASDYEDADIFVDGGTLCIDNVVFVNIHLNITRTIYISSAVKSWIYIRYTKDGAPAAGDRIAEGVDMYYLSDSDAQWFRHIDYDGSQNLWQFRRNGNVIELYLSDPSGIAAVEADGTARAYVSPDGTLRLSGIPADEPCAVFRTDGTLVARGTAADLAARPVILAPGAYILRSRTTSVKFVR